MKALAPGLVGRAREIDRLVQLAEGARAGRSGALALSGPAGSGKSALLAAASAIVGDRSPPLVLLRARGIESEAELTFGGLLELLRPLAHLLPRLPGPQAEALEGALALGRAPDTDRFAVSAATLGIIGLAAEEAPMLVLVDDLHWLDAPSAEAILFAARRLWREGVAFAFTFRPEEIDPSRLAGLDVIEVAPLTAAECAELAGALAPATLDDEELRGLHRATGGNPLAVIETLRSLTPRGARASVLAPLPVADRIRSGLAARVAALDACERQALLTVAAAGTAAPVALIEPALQGQDIGIDALIAGERAGVLRQAGGMLEFDHPLTRSAVYETADPGRRLSAHRALALAAPDGSAERAWHLAAGSLGADEDVAAALERVSADGLARGAPASARRALERAAQLSPASEDAARRLLGAASAARLAGEMEAARMAVAAVLDRSTDPVLRSDAMALQLQIDAWRRPVTTAASIVAEAERIADVDRLRSARLLAEAAGALLRSGSVAQGVALAERATDALAALGERDDAIAFALMFARVMDGDAPLVAEDIEALGRRLARAAEGAGDLALLQQVAWLLVWIERWEAAAELLDHATTVARSRAPGSLPFALATRAELRYRTGRWAEGLADAEEAASLASDFDQAHPRGLALACLCRIQAVLGLDDEVRATAAEAARIGLSLGGEDSPISAWGAPALGMLELSRDRPDAAIPYFQQVVRAFERSGILEPGVVHVAGLLVESLIRAGLTDEARPLLDELTARATRAQRALALAAAARCAGMLARVGSEADAHFAEAIAHADERTGPFERARTEMAWGESLLARRRRREGREHLRRALADLETLGAVAWADRVVALLRTAGVRSRPRAGRSGDLTPQELQVALVLGSGATVKEAAQALVLGERTVEGHRSRIYRKLGVSTKEELARHPLVAGAADRVEAEGTTTICFTDIVDSTVVAARLGDVRWAGIVDRHESLVERLALAEGGRVVKFQGDGAMLAFRSARTAVRFATTLLGRVAGDEGHAGLELRVGLHAGEAEARGADYAGRAVIQAARICALAGPGEILVSDLVRELVEPSGEVAFAGSREVRLKGLPGTETVWSVTLG